MNTLKQRRPGTQPIRIAARLGVILAFTFVLSLRAGDKPSSTAHAKLELIAEDGSVAPGRTFWLGLLFDLEKGWHIYWVNPGDSGEPPRARWEFPAGFRPGAIRWPQPMRLGTASVADYGYEDRVLLMLPVQPPAELKLGGSATFAANANWLVCREICIPEKAQVSLSLPIQAASDAQPSAARELFAAARKRLPKTPPRSWKIKAESSKDNFVLSVETGHPESEAVFFPLNPSQIENTARQMPASFDRGVRLTLRKSDQLLRPVSALKGVLVLGSERAFEIAAPVAQK